MKRMLLNRLKNKESMISIIGLGYVGLPLMLCFAEKGYRVIGIDVDESKNKAINAGHSYIEHISSERITCVSDRITATASFAKTMEADVIILCVPTPLNKYREPDLSFVLQTMDNLLPYMRQGQLISLESTTYPGTKEEELKPRIENQGFIIGQDIFLVYSPEREDPGNAQFKTSSIPKVCGGDTEACREAGYALYSEVIDQVIPVSSTKVAEMTKLLENIHRSVNIGLVNEMKIVSDKMGIDIFEVIEAAATKPFGFVPYYPGPGIGGHCIPVDPFYLTWKAREFGFHTRFIELAGEVNSSMPHWVFNKIADALNAREKAIKNSRILILGVAYKRDVADTRESPSLEIMELVQEKGAFLSYSDPHVSVIPKMRAHHFEMNSVELTQSSISSYDCVVLVTAHSAFDYDLIAEHAKLIVDTRGAFKAYKNNSHIVSA